MRMMVIVTTVSKIIRMLVSPVICYLCPTEQLTKSTTLSFPAMTKETKYRTHLIVRGSQKKKGLGPILLGLSQRVLYNKASKRVSF